MPWTEEERSDTMGGLGLKREDVLRGVEILKQPWKWLGLKGKEVIRLGALDWRIDNFKQLWECLGLKRKEVIQWGDLD